MSTRDLDNENNVVSDRDETGIFDIDLKSALNAAFEREDISVSEDLIRRTMERIRAEEDRKPETGDAAGGVNKEENVCVTREDRESTVVDITEKRRRIRKIVRIAGSIAAAVVIGIIGISVINRNLLKKESTNATAPMAESFTASSSKTAYEANDEATMTEESAADYDYAKGEDGFNVENSLIMSMGKESGAGMPEAAADDMMQDTAAEMIQDQADKLTEAEYGYDASNEDVFTEETTPEYMDGDAGAITASVSTTDRIMSVVGRYSDGAASRGNGNTTGNAGEIDADDHSDDGVTDEYDTGEPGEARLEVRLSGDESVELYLVIMNNIAYFRTVSAEGDISYEVLEVDDIGAFTEEITQIINEAE